MLVDSSGNPIASVEEREDVTLGASGLSFGWINNATGLSVFGQDPSMETEFRQTTDLAEFRRSARLLYSFDGIFARIIDAVPDHAVRNWIKVVAKEDEQGETGLSEEEKSSFGMQVLDALEELDAQEKFRQLLMLDRLDGGSYMFIGTDDADVSRPIMGDGAVSVGEVLNLEVLQYNDVSVIERNRDARSGRFLEPEFYRIAGLTDSIHWTRMIRLQGIRRPERTRSRDQDIGISISERVFKAVRQWGSIMGYMEGVFKKVVQDVYKIKGLSTILNTQRGNQLLNRRMQSAAVAASSLNALMIDADTEDYETRTFSMAGYTDCVVRIMDFLAAVSGIPVGILFGQAPTGLSTDDSGARKAFFAMVQSQQKVKLRKPIVRVVDAILNSTNGPNIAPQDFKIVFLPLDEPTKAEMAETRKMEAETDQILIETKLLNPREARSRMRGDVDSPYVLDKPEGDVEENKPQVSEGIDNAMNVVKSYVSGEMSRQSALSMLTRMVGLEDEAAEEMLGDESFIAEREQKQQEQMEREMSMRQQGAQAGPPNGS